MAEHIRQDRKTNPSYNARAKRYYRRCVSKNPPKAKLKYRKYWLKNAYGLSVDQFEKIIKAQNKRCAICGIHQNKVTRNLVIDHNHKNGKVRSVLCIPCNSGLGMFKDDPSVIHKAAEYLRNHTDADPL